MLVILLTLLQLVFILMTSQSAFSFGIGTGIIESLEKQKEIEVLEDWDK